MKEGTGRYPLGEDIYVVSMHYTVGNEDTMGSVMPAAFHQFESAAEWLEKSTPDMVREVGDIFDYDVDNEILKNMNATAEDYKKQRKLKDNAPHPSKYVSMIVYQDAVNNVTMIGEIARVRLY